MGYSTQKIIPSKACIMLCKAPVSSLWSSHINERLNEAYALGLIGDVPSLPQMMVSVFVPNYLNCVNLDDINPTHQLRFLQIKNELEADKWSVREDLFLEASAWLCNAYSESKKSLLVCEAGYSKLGDPILQHRLHFSYNGRPFFKEKINVDNIDVVTTTLRRSRSDRLLGVILKESNSHYINESDKNDTFICDAFDNDSIFVVMPVKIPKKLYESIM